MPGFRTIPKAGAKEFVESLSEKTVALIVEPIQGESGVHVFPSQDLVEIRQICWEKKILFFVDEIQSGMWRTGQFLAWQSLVAETMLYQNLLPDGVSLAKGLAGGFPIGASWINTEYCDVLDEGSHGTTFGGSPLACHVALTVLEEIERKGLNKNILAMGNYLLSSLKQLEKKPQSLLQEVRGMGGMLGLELSIPSFQAAIALLERGLLVAPSSGNTIRLLPPLNVSFDQIQEAESILKHFLFSLL